MTSFCNIKDVINVDSINEARKAVIDLILCRGGRARTKNQEVSVRIWSDLPRDMLEQVIQIIDSPEDYLNFIAVCTTWRSIARAIENNSGSNLPLFQSMPKKCPLPILLQQHGRDSEVQYCYSITRRKFYKVHVTELHNKWIHGSWRGWLSIIDGNDDDQIHLFNPITKVQLALPPVSTLPRPFCYEKAFAMYINKIIVVSSVEIHAQSNCIIVALLHKTVNFCRIGDDKWNRIYPSLHDIKDVIEFKGLLHAIDIWGTLFLIEISPKTKVIPVAVNLNREVVHAQYLSESSEDLFLIQRIEKDDVVGTISFKVYRLAESERSYKIPFHRREHDKYIYPKELVHKVWEEIESLDDRMFFVGYNRTLCLDSSLYSGCKGNCVYFSDDYGSDAIRGRDRRCPMAPHDNGVYHMDSKELEFIKDSLIDSLPMAAIWFCPNPW